MRMCSHTVRMHIFEAQKDNADMLGGIQESANLRGPDVASLYGQLAALVMVCFIAYPVCLLATSIHSSLNDYINDDIHSSKMNISIDT
jgi:bacteriorhodopsin